MAGRELLWFFLPLMPSSPSPDAPDVFQVSNISVCLTYQEVVAVEKPPGKNKKGAKLKMQMKTENKEISFSFEDNTNNYLNFLSMMLVKHGYDKYTPVTSRRRFGLRVIVPPNKACGSILSCLFEPC